MTSESKVAVLVDCDNTNPDAVKFALRVVGKFGRVVVKRGYGNQETLNSRWQESLVELAFTPCLQYQYARRKNTADMAMALDALEALFDQRADCFFLVTSDSDFVYLCRKLRERGATVYIVGEGKTPLALRNASDQFFEWVPSEALPLPPESLVASSTQRQKTEPLAGKRRPRFVVEAVTLLASDTSEGKVSVGALGQYLRRTSPELSPAGFGHNGLLDMLKTYDLLSLKKEEGGHYTVRLASGQAQTSEQVSK